MSDQPVTSIESPSKKTIDTVETFIQRVLDHDIEFTKEAGQIILFDLEEPLAGQSISDNLAHLMTMYQENKDNANGSSYAQQILSWINRAYTYGVIKEAPGLITKLRQCQEEKTKIENQRMKLQSDIEKLSSEASFLKGRIIELERGKIIVSTVGDKS
jgi:hypothetical protein